MLAHPPEVRPRALILFRRRPAPSVALSDAPNLAGDPAPFSLAVLNLGGRDPEQHFPAGAGQPESPGSSHPPVNYHAYAACSGGSFHSRLDKTLATGRPVLLLLRQDLGPALRCLRRLKKAGCTVAVAFKEAGSAQVAKQMMQGANLRRLVAVVDQADGCLASSPWLADFFTSLRPTPAPEALLGGQDNTVRFLPTPYPVDDPRWNFSVPPVQRRGIFVGTREYDVSSRQHLRAVLAARGLHATTGEPVTVLNTEGRRGAKILLALGFSSKENAALRFVHGPLPYTDYLRFMARHKIVFQFDGSGVPGQVAGDALLCRVPCVGGDGAIERVVFPALSGHDKEPERLVTLAADLLGDRERYDQTWRDAQARALETVSFRAVAAELAAYYWTLKATTAYRGR